MHDRWFMKKNLEKIFASCSVVVALILVMILLVTAFGGISTDEFESQLVRGLILTLAVLYAVLAVTSLVLIFVNSDVVKEVTIRQEKGGSIRVSASVVTKLVKNTCKQIEGVKCQKVTLVSDEYGVRLKLNVKVIDKDVVEAETYVRTLLEEEFLGEFGFRFSSIEVKVVALTPHFKADSDKVNAKVQEKLASLKQAEEETPEDGNADDVQDEENVANAEENVANAEETEVTEEAQADDEQQAEQESADETAEETETADETAEADPTAEEGAEDAKNE